MTVHSPGTAPDVLVIGAGLIGLACAAAAAERGFTVQLVGESRVGEASLAAAGLLAPSIEREEGHVGDFATAARDRYPTYVEWLLERTGVAVRLNRDGIIRVAVSEAGVRGLRRGMSGAAEWLDPAALTAIEPALGHALGGVFHPDDGAVDNVRLYHALCAVIDSYPRISVANDIISAVAFSTSVEAVGRTTRVYLADRVVLAAGAWSATIAGLPRRIPVEPVRGQMIAYAESPLRRAVYGPTGYLVPRTDGRTLVGATMERAGYDSVTTPEGIARLERTAAEVIPHFADLQPAEAWAGLRPISADLQPILGPDPDEPRLLYATGHSRNGVLMTPITGDCIASFLLGEPTQVDVSELSITRFTSAPT